MTDSALGETALDLDLYDPAAVGLRHYLTLVARQVGVGAESCSIQFSPPVGAYIAVDQRLPGFPDRDVALLWDGTHGWALAIETHGGADLNVLGYLGHEIVPPPRDVADVLGRALNGTGTALAQPPPARAGSELTDIFTGYACDEHSAVPVMSSMRGSARLSIASISITPSEMDHLAR